MNWIELILLVVVFIALTIIEFESEDYRMNHCKK